MYLRVDKMAQEGAAEAEKMEGLEEVHRADADELQEAMNTLKNLKDSRDKLKHTKDAPRHLRR
jgi:hypothetical protein